MKKILLIISLVLFSTVVKADLTGKKVFCESNQPNDLEKGFLSSKAPLAKIILGLELGDIVEWDTAGFIREIKIIGVKQMEVQ